MPLFKLEIFVSFALSCHYSHVREQMFRCALSQLIHSNPQSSHTISSYSMFFGCICYDQQSQGNSDNAMMMTIAHQLSTRSLVPSELENSGSILSPFQRFFLCFKVCACSFHFLVPKSCFVLMLFSHSLHSIHFPLGTSTSFSISSVHAFRFLFVLHEASPCAETRRLLRKIV